MGATIEKTRGIGFRPGQWAEVDGVMRELLVKAGNILRKLFLEARKGARGEELAIEGQLAQLQPEAI